MHATRNRGVYWHNVDLQIYLVTYFQLVIYVLFYMSMNSVAGLPNPLIHITVPCHHG